MVKVVITFKIDTELLQELNRFCALRGLTRSYVIRKAIIEYIRGNGSIPYPKVRVKKVVLT